MPLETKIKELNESVNLLIETLKTSTVTQPIEVAKSEVAATVAEKEVVKEMPTAPAFNPAPEPVPDSSINCPFNEHKGLIAYVMESYKALGPQKGSGIQDIMSQLGYQNVNDIKPEHYGQLFQAIEELKK